MKTVAAIDVGSFEIEMGIYEISQKGGIRLVDSVNHVIGLGSDTYATGVISNELTEELISILTDFRRIMQTYRCSIYKAVATSAMREAANRAVILDQIATRTGLKVEVISNAEQRMLSFKAIASRGQKFEDLIQDGTAVIETTFGSTQITLFDRGQMVGTQNMRLGALRLRDMISEVNSAQDEREFVMGEIVDHMLEIYKRIHLGDRKIKSVIALGEPIRMIFNRLMRMEGKDPAADDITDRRTLLRYLQYVTDRTDSQLEDSLDVTMAIAGVMFPAAVVFRRALEMTGADVVWCPGTRLIDGIAAEYAYNHRMIRHPHDFDKDIISAVREIASHYGEGTPHRDYGVRNALKIFDVLKKSQGFTKRDRLLLETATLLHHCGRFINMGHPNLSSCDIIHETEIIGLSEEEHEMIAQILKNDDEHFNWSGSSMQVAKFTAIIHLSDALDRSAKLKGGDYTIRLDEERHLNISTKYTGDMTLERLSFEKNKRLFIGIFGIEPIFHQKRVR